MSNEIFRFMAIRPPREPNDETPLIRLKVEGDRLRRRISDAGGPSTSGMDLRDAARELVSLPEFRTPPKYERELVRAARTLRAGRGPMEGLELEPLRRTASADEAEQIRDNLVARILVGEAGARVEALADAVRVLNAAERTEGTAEPIQAESWLDVPILVETGVLRHRGDDGFADSDILEFRRAHFGPVGVGDLLVVEQEPLRYEMGEISHIETALPHEFRKRVHRRLKREEESTLTVVEETTETEEDLQTAERFELQTEAESEIQRDTSLEAGLTVTAKYGPTVEATATMAYASNTSKREATRRASDFARDIVSRSVKKVSEKMRRESRRSTLRETEETNVHKLDNAAEDEPVVGVYRYVDKIDRAKLVNYGERLLFEFIIPEPGEWLRNARSDDGEPDLEKPQPPMVGTNPLRPGLIKEGNYQQLASKAGVTQIPLPPPKTATASKTVHQATDPESTREYFAESGVIELPEGYLAKRATVSVALTPGGLIGIDDDSLVFTGLSVSSGRVDPENKATHVRVAIGRREAKKLFRPGFPGDDATTASLDLDDQMGTLPYFVTSYQHEILGVTIEVECDRDESAVEAWQGKVFAAIQEAYQRRMAEYREALANAKASRSTPKGTHPTRLREIERTEIKKRAIQMLRMSVRFDTGTPLSETVHLGPVLGGSTALDDGEIVWDRLEEMAPYVRFFEQAFEWNQMTYHLYPYYWYPEGDWKTQLNLEHPDTLHGQFLRAGAARVIIPVRPGFRSWVHYFLWSQGRLPDTAVAPLITDETWLPVAVEIAESTGRKPDDRVVLDCWEVRLPTNLITLDDGRPLPQFAPTNDCPPVEPDE